MSDLLQLTIHGPLTTKASAASPVVDETNPGLRVAATDIARDGEMLTLTLLLSYGFPDDVFLSYKDISSAIAVAVQEPDSGASAVFSVVDPSINPLEPMVENYRPVPGGAVAFMRGWAGVPMSVQLGQTSRSLVLWATLQSLVSNVLRIDATGEAS